MILCVDCGNTRVKVGLGNESGWHGQVVFTRSDIGSLMQRLAAWPRPRRAIGCNVAGPAAAAAVEAALATAHLPIQWLTSSAELAGVRNAYERPEQLGGDRWASLIGARGLHSGACIVVCAGTATTVDVLDAHGVFQGGLILAGLKMMASALAAGTAQLDEAEGRYLALPRSTDDAIVSGAIEATVGAIDRMYARIAGQPAAACLLSGGAAEVLAPHLEMPLQRVDNLVLEGLRRIALA